MDSNKLVQIIIIIILLLATIATYTVLLVLELLEQGLNEITTNQLIIVTSYTFCKLNSSNEVHKQMYVCSYTYNSVSVLMMAWSQL